MSKKGAPRKSFVTFVQESKADTIDVPDDDGNILISVPQPHFWSQAAKDHATAERGPEMLIEIVGEDAATVFFDRCVAELQLDRTQAAATLISYLMDELGAKNLGESSASSTS